MAGERRVPSFTCSLLISLSASMCSFLSLSISSRSSMSDRDGCEHTNSVNSRVGRAFLGGVCMIFLCLQRFPPPQSNICIAWLIPIQLSALNRALMKIWIWVSDVAQQLPTAHQKRMGSMQRANFTVLVYTVNYI